MARAGILLGYGNPLLDIIVTGNEEFLKKYNLEPNNAILAEDMHKPMYKDMIDTFNPVIYVPGGATQNSIRFAQWLIGCEDATTYFGCVSHDEFGDILTKKALEAGVNVRYQYTEKEPTGTCAVIVTGTSRSLCANLAAANCFTENHLDIPENWALVEKCAYIYIAGFPLTVCPPAIMRIAKHSHNSNKTFMMNLAAPFICQFFKDPLMAALPYVDILFGNETEAETFAEANNFGTKDLKEMALKAAALPKENSARSRIVVFTNGCNPTVVAKDGTVTEYPVLPLKNEDIVDTTGAGDAFVGGFLAQLVHSKSIDECIRCAHWAAHIVIQRSGCTYPKVSEYK